MKKEIVEKILQETEAGYDKISKKFSQTRKHFWRELDFIKDYTHENDNVLDFGCGNGRLLNLLDDKNIKYYGVDVSQNLIEYAEKHYGGPSISFQKNAPGQTSLPFVNEFFNTIYSIAVFHHFPSKKHRQLVADELFRIAKPGGVVIIDVWNLWQKKYIGNIFQNLVDKVKGGNELDWNDCYISFMGEDGNKFYRFHHAFTVWELRKLFSNAGFKVEKCEVVGRWHIVLVGKK